MSGRRKQLSLIQRYLVSQNHHNHGCRFSPRAQYFSSNKPPPLQTPHPEDCDIIRGPSILRTSTPRPQPSLLFLPGLRSLPFWTQSSPDGSTTRVAYQEESLTYAIELLQDKYPAIKQEYEAVAHKLGSDYNTDTEPSKLHSGRWDWHSYMTKGKLQSTFNVYFPETGQILQDLRDRNMLFEGVPFGYAFFSTLHPSSRIAAHAAPMNLRLRIHLPLLVPPEGDCGIQVGTVKRPWKEGQALVLDDSFLHHVWNETPHPRVLLLVDLWHPDVGAQERKEIVQLFQHAADQGWWSVDG